MKKSIILSAFVLSLLIAPLALHAQESGGDGGQEKCIGGPPGSKCGGSADGGASAVDQSKCGELRGEARAKCVELTKYNCGKLSGSGRHTCLHLRAKCDKPKGDFKKRCALVAKECDHKGGMALLTCLKDHLGDGLTFRKKFPDKEKGEIKCTKGKDKGRIILFKKCKRRNFNKYEKKGWEMNLTTKEKVKANGGKKLASGEKGLTDKEKKLLKSLAFYKTAYESLKASLEDLIADSQPSDHPDWKLAEKKARGALKKVAKTYKKTLKKCRKKSELFDCPDEPRDIQNHIDRK